MNNNTLMLWLSIIAILVVVLGIVIWKYYQKKRKLNEPQIPQDVLDMFVQAEEIAAQHKAKGEQFDGYKTLFQLNPNRNINTKYPEIVLDVPKSNEMYQSNKNIPNAPTTLLPIQNSNNEKEVNTNGTRDTEGRNEDINRGGTEQRISFDKSTSIGEVSEGIGRPKEVSIVDSRKAFDNSGDTREVKNRVKSNRRTFTRIE